MGVKEAERTSYYSVGQVETGGAVDEVAVERNRIIQLGLTKMLLTGIIEPNVVDQDVVEQAQTVVYEYYDEGRLLGELHHVKIDQWRAYSGGVLVHDLARFGVVMSTIRPEIERGSEHSVAA